jgi:hypothetical protein
MRMFRDKNFRLQPIHANLVCRVPHCQRQRFACFPRFEILSFEMIEIDQGFFGLVVVVSFFVFVNGGRVSVWFNALI